MLHPELSLKTTRALSDQVQPEKAPAVEGYQKVELAGTQFSVNGRKRSIEFRTNGRHDANDDG